MSGIRSITRNPTVKGSATAASAPIYVDSDDNILKFIPAGSGTTEVQILDASSAQTLTNKTLTSPTITSPTTTAPVVTDSVDTKVLAASLAMTTNAVLATLTGFSWSVVAGATYVFEVNLPATMSTNGGLAVAFKYTTATLTSIQVQTYAATASDNTTAVSTQSTTTADQTKFFDSKAAAYTLVTLKGSFVVNAAGTVALQAAQNTSHSDTTTILLGAFAQVSRVL
jgi:hypothetical protein